MGGSKMQQVFTMEGRLGRQGYVMISLGLFLRHSSLPKQYLAVIYLAVGGALFLSSFYYYKLLWRVLVRGDPWRSLSDS